MKKNIDTRSRAREKVACSFIEDVKVTFLLFYISDKNAFPKATEIEGQPTNQATNVSSRTRIESVN